VEPNNSGESALCDLIADTQLYNTSKPSYGGAVVAFTNPEGIRSSLNLSGSKLPCNVTYGEAFSVQPFGNNLVTMTLSGTQIDALLEQQFDNTSFGNKRRTTTGLKRLRLYLEQKRPHWQEGQYLQHKDQWHFYRSEQPLSRNSGQLHGRWRQ